MVDKEISDAARALSTLGASKGGQARADSLSEVERSEIAKKAATSRWGEVKAKATHEGNIRLGDGEIACAVLDDGRRVLTQQTFLQAIGRAAKAKAGTGSKQMLDNEQVDNLPPFLAANNLKEFIDQDLRRSTTPVVYRTLTGGRAYGYEAGLLEKVCNVYMKLWASGNPTKNQERVIDACEILSRALTNVGIVALVDEATGNQYDRARFALAEILDAFIKNEIAGRWAKRFSNEFFRELFRLKGLQFVPFPSKKPLYVGHWINDIVYERLAPGVLDELRRKNPPVDGRRKKKHHQWLTNDIGHPKLQEHIASVITLMRACDSWEMFYKLLNKSLPKWTDMPLFDLLESKK